MFRTLRPADLGVLVVLVVGACTAAVGLCGGRHPIAMFALIMGWTWPALRGLMHWRREGGPHRGALREPDGRDRAGMPIHGVCSNTMALAALGGAWGWCLVPIVLQLHPAALLAPLGFPNSLRGCGVLLTLFGLVRPLWRAERRSGDGGMNAMTRDCGLFLVSGSPLLGGLAVAGAAVRLSFRASDDVIMAARAL